MARSASITASNGRVCDGPREICQRDWIDAAGEHCGVPPVLVVDDEPEMYETVKLIFQETPYQVHSVEQGEEALHVLSTSPERFIVLLDVDMPKLDGESVLRALLHDRRLRRRHALLLFSALPHLADRATLQRLLHSLDVDTIAKPFEIADLEQAVERARGKLLRHSGIEPFPPESHRPGNIVMRYDGTDYAH